MSIRDEVTYIFGAGASFYSMPLVKNFEKRFSFFNSRLRGWISTTEQRRFLKDSEEFINQVKAHLSFDTFFKKLFHTKRNDLILKYKAVLLIYFIYEHLIDVDTFKSVTQTEEKTHSIDPRYEALIAGLLNPVQDFSFGRKINFITWNYDLNLLLAIKNFIDGNERVYDFINNRLNPNNIFEIGSEVRVFHLNGYICHRQLNNISGLTPNLLSGVIIKLIEEYSNIDSDLFVNAQRINFAWETISKNTNQDLPIIVQDAISAVKKSKSVVLVGYSIPAYNRLYDSAIINKDNLGGANFFIQDIYAGDIKQIVEGDLGISYNGPYPEMVKIKTQTNCNSFILA